MIKKQMILFVKGKKSYFTKEQEGQQDSFWVPKIPFIRYIKYLYIDLYLLILCKQT